jgi:hypothetical protein
LLSAFSSSKLINFVSQTAVMKKEFQPGTDIKNTEIQENESPLETQTFLDKFFFGPHPHGDKETDEDEDAAILQQIIGWSRME